MTLSTWRINYAVSNPPKNSAFMLHRSDSNKPNALALGVLFKSALTVIGDQFQAFYGHNALGGMKGTLMVC